ncbi:MAG: methylmalonyl Co-A mutase-associated GTPase MeaB [Pseudomonadota bacterium]
MSNSGVSHTTTNTAAQRTNLADWGKAITRGDRAALARAITLLESGHPPDHRTAQALLAHLRTHSKPKPTFRLAITGPAGVGKSTFIEALGQHLLAHPGRVAVLAIDPGALTQVDARGAILADKTRMTRLATHEDAFVRPATSAGASGGIAHATREVIELFEGAGYDWIIIETLGAGQAEDIASSLCDALLLLGQPGSGDGLQALKRGLNDRADFVLVNKADGDLLDYARQAAQDFQHSRTPEDRQRVWLVSSLTGEGCKDFSQALIAWLDARRQSGALDARRRRRLVPWLAWRLHQEIDQHIDAPALHAAAADLHDGREDLRAVLATLTSTLADALTQALAAGFDKSHPSAK